MPFHKQIQTVLRSKKVAAVAVVLRVLVAPALCGSLYNHEATVVATENLTHDTKLVRFRFLNATNVTFQPGQYIFLKVPDEYVKEWNLRYHTSHDQVGRAYSFASSSSKLPLFDLIVKRVPAPPGKSVPPGLASTFIHDRLKVGDTIHVSRPMGQLSLRRDTGRPIVIVAGGTGAAPFISLMEYWFENHFDANNEIFFFFGVRSKRDLFLHERFQEWERARKNFHYIPALSNALPEDSWTGENGFIQAVVDRHIVAPSSADAYLAGPPIMVKEAVKVLNAKGVTDERIHYDAIAVR